MTRRVVVVAVVVIATVLLARGSDADAHRIDEYLQATLLTVEPDRIDASMRLVAGQSIAAQVIATIDRDADGAFSADEQRDYAERVLHDLAIAVDGIPVRPKLVSWRFPEPGQMRDGPAEIDIDYTIDVPRGVAERTLELANRHLPDQSVYLMNVLAPKSPDIRIDGQRRNPQQSVYAFDWQGAGALAPGDVSPRASSMVGAAATVPSLVGPTARGSWWDGLQLASFFRLGLRHIAEGTDHLMFLLVLLLPAPLLAAGARWGGPVGARRGVLKVLAIVTAFTVGHSITLAAAAFGGVDLPSRPVEVLIALSILVSAVHALRPIFPGREAVVAACFGLVHGLAFAATLDRLGVGRWNRLADLVAFNVGIETMQVTVVAAVLPSLLLMSRVPAYRTLRVAGATFAAAVSTGWIVERLFDVRTPADAVVDALARHAGWIAAALLAAGLATTLRRHALVAATGVVRWTLDHPLRRPT